MVIDLLFPVRGSTIPLHHAYQLYAAVSHVAPALHNSRPTGLFSINGRRSGPDTLALGPGAVLRLRLPVENIALAMPLTGKMLDLDGHTIQVGVPRVLSLVPAATLRARLVTIKLSRGGEGQPPPQVTPETFLAAARKQLESLEIQGEISIPVHAGGARAGTPQRRILRIKSDTVVGYPLHVAGLSEQDSVKLQETGLGGRRMMGCGLFVPVREDVL